MKFKGFLKNIYLFLHLIKSDEIHLGYVSPLGNRLFVRIIYVGVADLTLDLDFPSVMVCAK